MNLLFSLVGVSTLFFDVVHILNALSNGSIVQLGSNGNMPCYGDVETTLSYSDPDQGMS